MNEEYMCNYCSEGIIRPFQCNLNEAVLLCSNIDCDFYLQDFPQNYLISKPILNSLVTLKSNSGGYDYCVPSRFATSSLSPVASSSSSTDREVELLLNRSNSGSEFPTIHSNLQSCHSLRNSVNQEFSAALEGSRYRTSDMTHSKFLLDFYGTSQHGANNSQDVALRKKDEEELNEMLNDGNISKSEAPETILDEALASWLQNFDNLPFPITSNDESNVLHIKDEPMNQLIESSTPFTLIPSGKSAFSEIHPRKPKQLEENNLVKSTEELLGASKLSKEINWNMKEANFLSPVGSGISEDSGYNEDEILGGTSKSTKTMFLTPLKNSIRQKCHMPTVAPHCSSSLNNSTCSDRSFPCLSMSNLFTFLELGINRESKHYQSMSTIPDINKKSLLVGNINIENMGSSDNLSNESECNPNPIQFSSNLHQNIIIVDDKANKASYTVNLVGLTHCNEEISKSCIEIFDGRTIKSEVNTMLNSEYEMLSCKKSTKSRPQSKELKVTLDGISNLNLVAETINGNSHSIKSIPPQHETKAFNISTACLDANVATSHFSATCVPCIVPINKINAGENDIVQSGNQDGCLKNSISQVEKCISKLTKTYKKGQIEIDPWSVPEIYLDELNIEVILDDHLKKDIIKNKLGQVENVCESEDKHIKSKINYQKIPEAEILQNVTVFRPISLRPEFINLKNFPFTTICSSKYEEPVRLSVGLLSPRKDLFINNSVNDICSSDGKLANSGYFDSLLSSVDFDESFLHTHEENKGNGFENLSSNFLDDLDVKGKQNCVNKIANEEIVNNYEGSESELTIISVDANDEPFIYRQGKRKFDEEFGRTDGIRKKSRCNSNSFKNREIISNKNCNLTQYISRDKLSCQNEVLRVVDRPNGLCKSHICLDSQQLKSNMASVIKGKINNLRQRLKYIDSKITLQNVRDNHREINTHCFGMSYELKNYGDIKKSLAELSDNFKNILSKEEESSFLDLSSEDDLGFMGISNEAQDIYVEECEPLSDKLSQFLVNKYSPLSLFGPNTRPYVNKNKCYKCHRKSTLCYEVGKSRPKMNYNFETLSPLQDKALLDYKQCLKASVPKYMKSSFHNNYFRDSYFKEIPKRKYIDKFTTLESKPNRDKISPLLDSHSEKHVLEFLKNSGWVITKCSPHINYQGPSNAISPTIIPPALQNQYGKTGSDVVLWTMTDDKVYNPKVPSSTPVNIEFSNGNGKRKSAMFLSQNPLPHLKVVMHDKNYSNKIVKVPEPKLKFSNVAFKDLFLGKGKKIVKRLNSHQSQMCSTQVRSKKSNLTALKIDCSNIFLPPIDAVKQKSNILDKTELDEFIELTNDNLAYNEGAGDGYVKAPSNKRSHQTFSNSNGCNDILAKKKIFKRMIPSKFCSNIALKKERKQPSSKIDCQLYKPSSSSEGQLSQSNLQSSEINQSQKLAEDALIRTIKNSDQVPLFLCVAHNDKTYVYHRKEYKES